MMFTLCWINKAGIPTWERLGSVKQVNDFIRKNDLANNDSLFIFEWAADNYTLTKPDFDNKYNN